MLLLSNPLFTAIQLCAAVETDILTPIYCVFLSPHFALFSLLWFSLFLQFIFARHFSPFSSPYFIFLTPYTLFSSVFLLAIRARRQFGSHTISVLSPCFQIMSLHSVPALVNLTGRIDKSVGHESPDFTSLRIVLQSELKRQSASAHHTQPVSFSSDLVHCTDR